MNAPFETRLKCRSIFAGANQLEVLPLILAPFAEEILGRSNRQRKGQQQADPCKAGVSVPEKRPPQSFELIPPAQLLTPGPDPFPACTAKERSHRGQHHSFYKKPTHDPE